MAYHILCHSILSRASGPVEFIPIRKQLLPEWTRIFNDGSTEFSFSRFMTPYLCGYSGQSVFMDCDMLVRCDIYELLDYIGSADVAVVKHDYTPIEGVKFLGNEQTNYPKKNWSSLMVFNNWKTGPRRLTPEVASHSSGKYLHRFEWADSINSLPVEYNHLVGEYEPNPSAKIAHFTLGTPCFKGYEDQEWAKEWFEERERMLHAD